MAGAWSGTGVITVNNNKEKLRCRANYNVSNDGSTVDLQIRCASDSYKFDLQGGVNYINGASPAPGANRRMAPRATSPAP